MKASEMIDMISTVDDLPRNEFFLTHVDRISGLMDAHKLYIGPDPYMRLVALEEQAKTLRKAIRIV